MLRAGRSEHVRGGGYPMVSRTPVAITPLLSTVTTNYERAHWTANEHTRMHLGRGLGASLFDLLVFS